MSAVLLVVISSSVALPVTPSLGEQTREGSRCSRQLSTSPPGLPPDRVCPLIVGLPLESAPARVAAARGWLSISPRGVPRASCREYHHGIRHCREGLSPSRAAKVTGTHREGREHALPDLCI